MLSAITLLTTCIPYKKYQHQEILSKKSGDNNRILSVTFKQWISHPAGDRLATITREYDSSGRITKEYGFNNPHYYKKKYLMETVYRGTRMYVMNKFIWCQADTTQDFSNYNSKFFEETIFPDSTNTYYYVK